MDIWDLIIEEETKPRKRHEWIYKVKIKMKKFYLQVNQFEIGLVFGIAWVNFNVDAPESRCVYENRTRDPKWRTFKPPNDAEIGSFL